MDVGRPFECTRLCCALGLGGALASGSFPAAPGDGYCKAFAGLAHLNSVRRALFLGLFADKETAKKKVSDLPDVH